MNNKKLNSFNKYPLSGIEALTIGFIMLKLCDVIDWSWFLVLLPVIVSVSLSVIIVVLTVLFKKN